MQHRWRGKIGHQAEQILLVGISSKARWERIKTMDERADRDVVEKSTRTVNEAVVTPAEIESRDQPTMHQRQQTSETEVQTIGGLEMNAAVAT